MTRLAFAAVRVAACAALFTVVSTAPASAATTTSYEKQVVASTNAYRAEAGKGHVKMQKCVDRWANNQARWMARRSTMEHRDGQLRKILRSCKLTRVSENIAWNFSSGSDVVSAWAHSPGHAKNMRAAKMRYIGVGVARASDGDIYVAQVFGTRK
ncbi:MAG: CAP domain-containing protein [Aeromicrobium sp.]